MRALIGGTGNANSSHQKINERMLRMRRAFEGFKVIMTERKASAAA